VGEGEEEKRGLEDPRVVKIGETFFMTCAAYAGREKGVNLKMVTSKHPDKDWKKHNFALPNFDYKRDGGFFVRWGEKGPIQKKADDRPRSKAGAIFPEKINGTQCQDKQDVVVSPEIHDMFNPQFKV